MASELDVSNAMLPAAVFTAETELASVVPLFKRSLKSQRTSSLALKTSVEVLATDGILICKFVTGELVPIPTLPLLSRVMALFAEALPPIPHV